MLTGNHATIESVIEPKRGTMVSSFGKVLVDGYYVVNLKVLSAEDLWTIRFSCHGSGCIPHFSTDQIYLVLIGSFGYTASTTSSRRKNNVTMFTIHIVASQYLHITRKIYFIEMIVNEVDYI